ncbi:28455_t:CDS:2 [Gigaspora margarita]|uniref:28455_t:CDS:1 n=1 Tax=Gigaspora margarita TaxID=4874 RepID=A0ABN7VN96_GIGMA|nr:28455_t:CDS:2 [Gigaspora margarita]
MTHTIHKTLETLAIHDEDSREDFFSNFEDINYAIEQLQNEKASFNGTNREITSNENKRTSSYTTKMLLLKSQNLRKLVLQGIKFNKDNLANLVPNLEVLSIRNSFGNPLKGQNILKNLQKLELVDNDIELNKIMLKAKCKALKFFIILRWN